MNLFKTIESVHPTITGWCSIDKATALAALVYAYRPHIIVEIGVWAGASLIPMALAAKEVGRGKVYAIDPWSQDAGKEGYDGVNAEWWGRQDYDAILRSFEMHVGELGLRGIVETVRKRSDMVVPPYGIGVLHVDGAHSEQAIRDIQRFGPNVIPGGFVVMDDMGWANAGDCPVARAVDHLIAMGFERLWSLKDANCEWGILQKR